MHFSDEQMKLQKQAQQKLIQWTLVTTTAFIPKDVAIKMYLLL